MFKRVLELTTSSQPKYIIWKMRKDDQSTGDVENITKDYLKDRRDRPLPTNCTKKDNQTAGGNLHLLDSA